MRARVMLSLLALPAVGYAGICGWMYAKQRELIYFPQVTRIAATKTDFALNRGDVTLRGWRVNPGKPQAIIYFGGNAESVQNMRANFAQWFPDSTTYLVSYRGFGASDGKPEERALFADAVALYDQVSREHGSVAVIGRSLGSGVASYVASQRPVKKLALVTPFDSLVATGQAHYRWLPVNLITIDRYDSVQHLQSYKGPVLVVRAGRDEVIPPANTARLIAAMHIRPQVVDLPDADHSSLGNFPAYGEALSGFLNR